MNAKIIQSATTFGLFALLIACQSNASKVSGNLGDREIVTDLACIGLSGNTLLEPSQNPVRTRANALFRQVTRNFSKDENIRLAVRGFKDILRVDPSYGSAWWNLERLSEYSMDWTAAIRYLDGLFRYAPHSREAQIRHSIGDDRGRLTKIAKMPSDERKRWEYNELMALAHSDADKRHHPREAVWVCEIAHSIDPGRSEARAFRAYILSKQGSRVDPIDSEKNSASENFTRALAREVTWFQYVRKSYSDPQIVNTCSGYNPVDYPACFYQFVKTSIEPKDISTTGLILTMATGSEITVKAGKLATQDAPPEQRSRVKLQYTLAYANFLLGLIEKDQRDRKARTIQPPGPEADFIAAIISNTDDKFQIQALDNVKTLLVGMGSSECILAGRCLDLSDRYKATESRYWSVKGRAPKVWHPLSPSDIDELAIRYHVSPGMKKTMLGAGAAGSE